MVCPAPSGARFFCKVSLVPACMEITVSGIRSKVIRILSKPPCTDVPTRLDVGIKVGALAGLRAIDAVLCADEGRE